MVIQTETHVNLAYNSTISSLTRERRLIPSLRSSAPTAFFITSKTLTWTLNHTRKKIWHAAHHRNLLGDTVYCLINCFMWAITSFLLSLGPLLQIEVIALILGLRLHATISRTSFFVPLMCVITLQCFSFARIIQLRIFEYIWSQKKSSVRPQNIWKK